MHYVVSGEYRLLSHFGEPVFEADRNPESTLDELVSVPNFTKIASDLGLSATKNRLE